MVQGGRALETSRPLLRLHRPQRRLRHGSKAKSRPVQQGISTDLRMGFSSHWDDNERLRYGRRVRREGIGRRDMKKRRCFSHVRTTLTNRDRNGEEM